MFWIEGIIQEAPLKKFTFGDSLGILNTMEIFLSLDLIYSSVKWV